MGMWAFKPWDNDEAADWYSELMESTGLREKWLEGINSDPDDSPENIRAAAALFIMLGRVYIWPIEKYDEDLELAISRLEILTKEPEYEDLPELKKMIRKELSELQSRRKSQPASPVSPEPEPEKPWWKFW